MTLREQFEEEFAAELEIWMDNQSERHYKEWIESKLAELQEKYEEEVIQSALWSANYSTLKKKIEDAPRASTSLDFETLLRDGAIDDNKDYSIVEVEK